MVNELTTFIESVIRSRGNPAAPHALKSFVARALSYTGMKKTSFWRTLGNDTCLYRAVNQTATQFNGGYGSGFTVTIPGCGTYNLHDSLQMLRGDSCQ